MRRLLACSLSAVTVLLCAPGTIAAKSAERVTLPPVLAVRYTDDPPAVETKRAHSGDLFALLASFPQVVERRAAARGTTRATSMQAVRAALLDSGNPLPLRKEVLSSPFGMRMHPLLGVWRPHLGVDLAAPAGTPVYATADGLVSAAGRRGGYGLAITLQHARGLETLYGHMSRLNVSNGQRVQRGEVIGWVGSTGLSTGPHLHYGTLLNGRAYNPLPQLRRRKSR